MILNLEEMPHVGEDFDVVTIDLMKYSDDSYTPLINYMFVNDEEEQVLGGMTMLTGMSFDSYQAAAIFFGALVKHGFFLSPVSKICFVFDEDGNMIEEINWENYCVTDQSAPEGISIH